MVASLRLTRSQRRRCSFATAWRHVFSLSPANAVAVGSGLNEAFPMVSGTDKEIGDDFLPISRGDCRIFRTQLAMAGNQRTFRGRLAPGYSRECRSDLIR